MAVFGTPRPARIASAASTEICRNPNAVVTGASHGCDCTATSPVDQIHLALDGGFAHQRPNPDRGARIPPRHPIRGPDENLRRPRPRPLRQALRPQLRHRPVRNLPAINAPPVRNTTWAPASNRFASNRSDSLNAA